MCEKKTCTAAETKEAKCGTVSYFSTTDYEKKVNPTVTVDTDGTVKKDEAKPADNRSGTQSTATAIKLPTAANGSGDTPDIGCYYWYDGCNVCKKDRKTK